MQTLLPLLPFVIVVGLLVGSFLNVCIYRIPLGKTIVKGRSYCPKCGSLIRWYQNIPLVSYIFLKGRCSNCGEPISLRYPLIEFLTSVLFAIAFLRYGLSAESIFAMALFSALLVISLIDLDHMIIPDGLVIFIAVISIVRGIIYVMQGQMPWYMPVSGFFAASVPLLLLSLLISDSLGGGDLKLMAVAGIYGGPKLILMALFIGAVYGAFYTVPLLIRGKAGRKTQIPFGPFLSLGIATAFLFGESLWTIYMSLILYGAFPAYPVPVPV